MSHLKFRALVALFFLATLAQESLANRWRSILPLESKRADVGRLFGNPSECGRHQSETRVQPNAWRGLLPLKSSRTDVERLLGPPKGTVAGSDSYETKEEKVRVVYSPGSCDPSLEGPWKVPADTVLSITVFPQTTVLVSSLQLDMRVYKRSQEMHPENWAWFVNAEVGVMVHAMQNNGREEVMSITYRPATKDHELRCPNSAKTEDKKP